TGEVVGIFYSAKRLAELGIAVPQTWDEYLAALDAASAKGTQPMILGNIEKWPALHVFGPLQGAYVPADQIIALGMGNAGADWNSPENAQA
ncbi:extracellular solute-binding protein, partial [Acinetobacter baumannii]|nr:extracellular solute-binding protein [Acinetobacter baumannii]